MARKVLIRRGSPCYIDFGPDGPKSYAEHAARGEEVCPNYGNCYEKPGYLHPATSHQCIMRSGLGVAQAVLRSVPLDQAMERYRADAIVPANGYVWSSDRKRFVIIRDTDVATALVEEYAKMVLGITTEAKPVTAAVAPKDEARLSEEELSRRDGGGFRFF